MKKFRIYSHRIDQAEALVERLSAVAGMKGTAIGLKEEPEPPSSDTLVVHLKCSYYALLEGGKESPSLDQLYRRDLWVRRQTKDQDRLFDLYLDEVPDQFEALVEFLGGSPCPLNEWDAKDDWASERSEEVSTVENRLILSYAGHYLSNAGRRAFSSATSMMTPFRPEQDLSDCPGKSALLIDTELNVEAVKNFISYIPSGYFHSNLISICTNFAPARELLRHRFFRSYLESKAIKIWHESEWKEQMGEEYMDPRTSLLTCGFVLGDTFHPLLSQVVAVCQHCHKKVADIAVAAHEESCEYYQSREFEQRLEAIRNGTKPRILIEQACSSVFVKQFSRFCAAEYGRLGFEGYMHPNCPPDRCDNYFANTVEINRFKPDLVIRSPNSFARTPLQEIPGLPTIYPLQDHDPHMQFPEYVREHPMSKHSMALIIEDRFLEPIRHAGVPEDQLFFDYLPTEAPPFDVDAVTIAPEYDVGFVKTMSHYKDLVGIMKTVDQDSDLSDEEVRVLRQVDQVVHKQIHSEGSIPFEECQKMAVNGLWLNGILAYAHEQLCLRFISVLAGEGRKLALTGNNWEKFDGLGQYGLGYASDRNDYYQRFLRNKINLSINPWDIYHPRIFEGGRCGAFFLIYRMPDEIAWQSLPKQLVQGEHFDYFSSPDELSEKVDYYLKRPDLCKQIGLNLRKVVEEQFSYPVYCQTLFARFKHLIDTRGTEPSRPQPKATTC